MAITIDGVTYRNLQEQVGKNAEDIASLQDTQKKIISGHTPLEKATVKGPADIEGKLTAGGDAEIDGTLSLNSPDSLTFKTGSLIIQTIKKRYLHTVVITKYGGDASIYPTACSFLFLSAYSKPMETPQDFENIYNEQNVFACSGGAYNQNTGTFTAVYVDFDDRFDEFTIYGFLGTPLAEKELAHITIEPGEAVVKDTVIDLFS